MDLLTAIQLASMKAAEQPDHSACLRRVFRSYSKTFHTPLHTVEELPVEVVLTAYYEELYSEMDPKDRELEIAALLETEEQRKSRVAKKDSDAAAVSSILNDAALLEAIKVVGKKKNTAPKIGDPQKVDPTPGADGTPSKSTLSLMREIPPDIAMIFGE